MVQALGDGGHHAHLHQRLDHVAALQGELLGQVTHGDGFTDGDFTHHRRGRPVEAGAGARLVRHAARGLAATATGAGGATRALGCGQVQLAGETRGIVVVLDAGHHRV